MTHWQTSDPYDHAWEAIERVQRVVLGHEKIHYIADLQTRPEWVSVPCRVQMEMSREGVPVHNGDNSI